MSVQIDLSLSSQIWQSTDNGFRVDGDYLPIYFTMRLAGAIQSSREFENETKEVTDFVSKSEIGSTLTKFGETFVRIQ